MLFSTAACFLVRTESRNINSLGSSVFILMGASYFTYYKDKVILRILLLPGCYDAFSLLEVVF